MVDYELLPYEDELFQDKQENVSDLHAYYMTQFNLEVENSKSKVKDNFKYGVEESFNFEDLGNWNAANTNSNADFEIIDQVIDSSINDQNIKDVLLDLDSIEFDEKSFEAESSEGVNRDVETNLYDTNNDYIDDESLLDELCREDGEACRLSSDGFSEGYLQSTNEKNLLPSIETAFSKRYCNYSSIDENQKNSFTNAQESPMNTGPIINNLDHYSYPNNILYNLDSTKKYILPDTPTSCTEFNFGRNERKVSVSESIESDVNSSSYYDENSETFDEEELFVNLEDFGLSLERENEVNTFDNNRNQIETQEDGEKTQGNSLDTCLDFHPKVLKNKPLLCHSVYNCYLFQ